MTVDLYQAGQVAPAAEVRPLDDWIPVLNDVVELAKHIANTPFVPETLRGSVPATAAAILTARELGVPPMTGLANIHSIKGKTGLSALLMRALILGQGHEWHDVDVTDTRVVVRGRRKGETEWAEASFTADQAKRAGIQLGGYPQDKLYARATVRLARRKFADIIAGMPYSAEELEDGVDDEQTDAVAPAEPAGRPAQRTAQRRQPARARQQQPEPAAPPAATVPQETAEPPLPGEDDQPHDPEPPVAAAPQKLLGVIHQHFKRLGYGDTEGDRTARLAVTAKLAGIDTLATSSDLTDRQAHAVADTLGRCRDFDALQLLLETGEHDG